VFFACSLLWLSVLWKTAQEQNTNGKHAECDHVKKRQRSRILKHMKINIWRILYTWRWPCRPKHVVKDSENTIKLHADGNITFNTHWTIQYSRMLKYSIRSIRSSSWCKLSNISEKHITFIFQNEEKAKQNSLPFAFFIWYISWLTLLPWS
jgi:hypothetical protein